MIENATPAPQQQQLKQISRLGIVVSELAPVTKLPAGFKYGLVVQGVNDNAQFAGVMPGDIIVGIGNHNLSDFNDFVNYIAKYNEGNVIALKILRSDGRRFWTVFIPITVMKD
ncbi:MAG: PDZ domain-containing protein, partial [Burkholderiales bacterium]